MVEITKAEALMLVTNALLKRQNAPWYDAVCARREAYDMLPDGFDFGTVTMTPIARTGHTINFEYGLHGADAWDLIDTLPVL